MCSMTATGSAGVSSDVDGPKGPRRRTVAVLLVALTVVLFGVWQWRSVDAFYIHGNGVAMPVPVGATALLGVGGPREGMDPATLTIQSVEPQVVEGDAAVDVVVCHSRPGAGGLGAAQGGLGRFCASHETADGARMGPEDYLILRVRSDQAGPVVVEAVKVTYSHGWRRGSQVLGLTAEVMFGPAPAGADGG